MQWIDDRDGDTCTVETKAKTYARRNTILSKAAKTNKPEDQAGCKNECREDRVA
jgi:hypothetical protein